MSKSAVKTIAITMGDPKGIGPEVIRKALLNKTLSNKAQFIVVGNKKVLGSLSSSIKTIDISSKTSGEGAFQALAVGALLIKTGSADALVTAPLSKESVNEYFKSFQGLKGKKFVGHTEYLAETFRVKNFDMMFVAPNMRLTIVTRHVPLKDVPALITKKAVSNSIALMHDTLKSKFKIHHPKIAVLGLNPHAGEGGLLGKEDNQNIRPAIEQSKTAGINAVGPLPADTFFAYGQSYDGVIAMYHDQGLAPIKGIYMKNLVNFTAGLPFIRTSPAHGTAFDIAGKNKADPSSMIAAIQLAIELA